MNYGVVLSFVNHTFGETVL